MRGSSNQSAGKFGQYADIWTLVRQQHGAIARRQLLDLGLSAKQIERRIASGRLHPVWRGVYAVGRPQLSKHGRWVAAVLACGPHAALSHGSAAALWGFGKELGGLIDVSVPVRGRNRLRGIWVHRRTETALSDVVVHEGIPLTSPVRTLIDQATRLRPTQLERAVNEADKLDRVRADVLYASLDDYRGQPGVASLRKLLDPLTFRLSDSELEQLMRPLARAVGLPMPEIPPDRVPAKTWLGTRPDPPRRRHVATPLLPRADQARTCPRAANPPQRRGPGQSSPISARLNPLPPNPGAK